VGNLKPGATLIYERVGDVIYEREFGADPAKRRAVGWDYDVNNPKHDPRTKIDSAVDGLRQDRLWGEIRRAAQENTALRDVLDQAVAIYQLSRPNDK